MKTLNYDALQGYEGYLLQDAPEKILQFGEGNFLRAFVDYFVDVANEKAGFNGKVAVVQPIAHGGLQQFFDAQQGLYTLYLRGFENGAQVDEKRVISAISRYINPYADYAALLECAKNPELMYIVSNTTEAGITYDAACQYDDAPPASFPAKLARFLHERWKTGGSGLVILSCELIDDNGKQLEACVQKHVADWKLETEFTAWLAGECLFCSTLVDRIVTGYPRAEAESLNAENGYTDNLLDVGEVFGLWVIEGPEWLAEELPFAKAGMPVKVVADHSPYKKQKVRILNGAHTSMVPVAIGCGEAIVRDCMYDADIAAFMQRAVWDEVIPVVPLPKNELEAFATATVERFKNPFIDHSLLAIALNSTAKWRARVLPTVKDYLAERGTLPPCLAFSLAAYINLYATRDDMQDDAFVLDFFAAHKQEENLAALVLQNTDFWGEDLSALPRLTQFVAESLAAIHTKGVRAALDALLAKGA